MNNNDIEKEILIATFGGHQYFLGPEHTDELDWYAAKHWCNSLGEDYELPNRLVMLAIGMNEDTSSLLAEYSCYWTSTEASDDVSLAWIQYQGSGYPGLQNFISKSLTGRVRAVRRRPIEGEEE